MLDSKQQCYQPLSQVLIVAAEDDHDDDDDDDDVGKQFSSSFRVIRIGLKKDGSAIERFNDYHHDDYRSNTTITSTSSSS